MKIQEAFQTCRPPSLPSPERVEAAADSLWTAVAKIQARQTRELRVVDFVDNIVADDGATTVVALVAEGAEVNDAVLQTALKEMAADQGFGDVEVVVERYVSDTTEQA